MSYDPTSTADRDRARALLGDTDFDELLTDAHMDAVLTQYGYTLGVAFLADELAVRFARQPGSVSLPSGLSVSWPDRVAAWVRLATRLRIEAGQASAARNATSRAKNIVVW
jgi:hypothetical protein